MRPFQAFAEPFLAFETQGYRAVFKPAGMHSTARTRNAASSGAAGGEVAERVRDDLLSWIRKALPDQAEAFGSQGPGRLGNELGMLSRLDRDTSGLILFARDAETFARSLDLQSRGLVRKFYRLRALPGSGELAGSRPLRQALPKTRILDFMWDGAPPAGSVIASRFRSFGERGSRVACVTDEFAGSERKPLTPGEYRTTLFSAGKPQAGEFVQSEGALEAEAMITSGFRHQIRAHLAWVGMPIVGDRLYGGDDAPRLYLESHRLELPGPEGGILVFELYEGTVQGGDRA